MKAKIESTPATATTAVNKGGKEAVGGEGMWLLVKTFVDIRSFTEIPWRSGSLAGHQTAFTFTSNDHSSENYS